MFLGNIHYISSDHIGVNTFLYQYTFNNSIDILCIQVDIAYMIKTKLPYNLRGLGGKYKSFLGLGI